MKQLKNIVHVIAMFLFAPFGLVGMILLLLAKFIGFLGMLSGCVFVAIKDLKNPVWVYQGMKVPGK